MTKLSILHSASPLDVESTGSTVRTDSANVNTFGDVRVAADSNGPVDMDSFDPKRSNSSWIRLGRLINKD